MTAQDSTTVLGDATPQAAAGAKFAGKADDMAMLRAAAEVTRDIGTARPDIYWPDMLLSACVGYAALAGAILIVRLS